MIRQSILIAGTALLSALSAWSQITLNTVPSRSVGHAKTPLQEQNVQYGGNPNLVEGRELFQPQGVAVDSTVSPSPVYVADAGNNRVLGWKDATAFTNGQAADIVIGQNDFFTVWPEGPTITPRAPGAGSYMQSGLYAPTSLAAINGDLYVADAGNNRVLRYPKPFTKLDHIPDLVIGQPSLSTATANYTGAVSAQGIYLTTSSAVYSSGLAFDSAGNLWVSDTGNKRVLEFAAADLSKGGSGLTPILVLGQVDFTSTRTATVTISSLDQLAGPAGLAFDAAGRLYVCDADQTTPKNLSRVIVFAPTNGSFATGQAASGILGVTATTQTTAQKAATLLYDPTSVFLLPSNAGVGVVDSSDSRILIFAPFEQWPAATASPSAAAVAVAGHNSDFTNGNANNTQSGATFTALPSASVFYAPNTAVVFGGQVYISDAGNNRVLAAPLSGTSIGPATRVLGQDRLDTGGINLVESRGFEFNIPGASYHDSAIAIDSTGSTPHLFVADTYNNRVLGFKDLRKISAGVAADLVIGQGDLSNAQSDPKNFQTAMCNYPTGDPSQPTASNLCSPVGLLVDSLGNLWVADRGNGRVVRFPAPFAQTGQPKADLVLGQASLTTARVSDATASTMASPYGLAMTATGILAVSDQSLNRVLFFVPSSGKFTSGQAATWLVGQSSFRTSASGSTLTTLNAPHHIAVDSADRLYVADTGNSRLLIYDTLDNPYFPAFSAPAALAITGLSSPQGLYVNPTTGEIWVADTGNGRYVRYPQYISLITNQASIGTMSAGSTSYSYALAVAQDPYGALVAADGANRVTFFYPGLTAQNLANNLSARPLAPGMIATLIPSNTSSPFGTATADFAGQIPLPTDISDIQVLFDGTLSHLFMVSPQQVNFYVPMGAKTSGYADVQVVSKTTGQVYGAGLVSMYSASPALFLNPATQTGTVRLAAVINHDDGTINGPTHPAKRNGWIEIYGTGLGYVAGGPADGDIALGLNPGPVRPVVALNGISVDDSTRTLEPGIDHIYYSGLAPGMVGVWQINVLIPNNTAAGTLSGLTTNQVDLVVFLNSMPSYDYTQYRTIVYVQ